MIINSIIFAVPGNIMLIISVQSFTNPQGEAAAVTGHSLQAYLPVNHLITAAQVIMSINASKNC